MRHPTILHALLLVKQRTMCRQRPTCAPFQFGLVATKGIGRVDKLLGLAESDATLPGPAKAVMRILTGQLESLDVSISELKDEIARAHAQNQMSRLLDEVPGIGKLIASVISASVPDPNVLVGHDFAAWLGLTPRQNPAAASQRWAPSPNRATGI